MYIDNVNSVNFVKLYIWFVKASFVLAGLYVKFNIFNRLVRMVLTKPSIPYSLKIDGEWCRIIHNHRQRMCSNCQAVGHSHRKCPEITCRVCGEKGHLSYDCTQEFEEPHENIEENITDNTAPDENTTNAPEDNLAKNSTKDSEPPQSTPEEPETFQEAKPGENYYQ